MSAYEALTESVNIRLRAKVFWSAIKRRLGLQSEVSRIDRWHLESDADCVAYLARHVPTLLRRPTDCILIVWDEDPRPPQLLQAALESSGNKTRSIHLRDVSSIEAGDVSCIAAGSFNSKIVSRIARRLLESDRLRNIPLEYILSRSNYDGLEKHDRPSFKGFYFINPLLGEEIDYLEIYEESLQKFEQKCDVRDYLDLAQMIREIILNKVPGDVAEFGSYKGHSGYLIAKLLEAHKCPKLVYLFDAFEAFPSEPIGVDSFWSLSHPVSFDEVANKFRECGNVRLIKGEFQSTVPQRLPSQICLAYIDCDSYRATKFLVSQIYDRVLANGGVIAFEDYGHPALLGNRIAVDELFALRPSCFRFFSQFSGIYVVRKSTAAQSTERLTE